MDQLSVTPGRDASARLDMLPLGPEDLDTLDTPAYVFDPVVVINRYKALRAALGTELVVSMKANSLLDLALRCLPAFVDGVELASIGELGVVVGRTVAPRYVNNPSMDRSFVDAALASDARFIVDSVEQAHLLASTPRRRGAQGVLLRLNAGAWRVLPPGRTPDQFGMGQGDAVEAGKILLDAGFRVLGTHCFAGSHTFSSHNATAVRQLGPRLLELEEELGIQFERVNLGGGFAEDWLARPDDVAAYRAALATLPDRWIRMHEAGRAVFAHAGVFVTRVRATKTLNDEHIAICDGGIAQNFLLGVTEGVLRKHQVPTVTGPQRTNATLRAIRYAGSSCSRSDIIGVEQQPAALPLAGAVCVFHGCGAYNSSYTVAPFLQLPGARHYVLGMADA